MSGYAAPVLDIHLVRYRPTAPQLSQEPFLLTKKGLSFLKSVGLLWWVYSYAHWNAGPRKVGCENRKYLLWGSDWISAGLLARRVAISYVEGESILLAQD